MKSPKAVGLGAVSMTPLLDIIFLLVVVLAVALRIQMPFINPPPTGEEKRTVDLAPSAIYVQVEWEFAAPHDLDTYLNCRVFLKQGEADVSVNFRQKEAGFLSLTRDDLGRPSPENFEVVLGNSELPRLPPNSLCTLNVHLYSAKGGALPIQGRFHAILHKDHVDELPLTPVDGTSFALTHKGQEITLLQLLIDEAGAVMPDVTVLYPNTAEQCLATCD